MPQINTCLWLCLESQKLRIEIRIHGRLFDTRQQLAMPLKSALATHSFIYRFEILIRRVALRVDPRIKGTLDS